ncbi:MAG: hypothetical protein Q8J59_10250 [Methylotenera sp.]|nr:hypothetical protein [Methylotenera sp.]MDP2282055.1 hypothetical protein [Methylotenera sp.]MDP3059460.1 hypothetical protein [Methylotenera sp.]
MESKSNVVFTKELVLDTLQTWCDNVVSVGKVFSEKGDYKSAAAKVLSSHYDYDNGKVLFKPTLAFGEQTFRPTKKGALAYFVGGDADFPNDGGFKIKPWVKVWFTDEDFTLINNVAVVQCNVHLIAASGDQIMVDKSFVFKSCDDGKIRIILHHSSLPFAPAK